MTHTATSVEPTRPVASASTGFRPDIEGLRALAIIPVLLFHGAEFLAPQDSGVGLLVQRILDLVPGGYLGVDVFFVISGFLITGLLVREVERDGTVHFGRFYARRVRRILPAATVVLLTTLVAAFILLPAARAAQTAVDVLWAGLFNADVHFAQSGVDYMGEAIAPSPVLHFWSLNDEEKFYVVWPVVLLVASGLALRRFRTPLRPTLFVALLALAVPSLLWSQHLVTTGDPAAYFSALSRAFELAAGGLLAIAWPWVTRVPRAARVMGAILGFAVIVWCMATYSSLTAFPGFAALPVVLGTVAVMAGHEAGVVSRGLSTGAPRWFGRISYSLYLWHWPILVLAAAGTATGQLGATEVVALMVAAVLVSWLSYRVIEQPPQRWAALRSTRTALWVGLALIVSTVLASLAVGAAARAAERAEYAAAAEGITASARTDDSLLFIGDSITTRGLGPLETALGAGGWDVTVDGLGGRPLVSGAREDWTPLCDDQPACGADLVLTSGEVPGTVVMAVGTNAFNIAYDRVAEPTATDSGLRPRLDAEGRYVVAGQDAPEDFARGVDTIMGLVPESTRVYWVGFWLDDRLWGNVPWRDNNAAIKAAVARHPNATYLDYAAFVDAEKLPHMKDGSHPTPEGMIMRARWIAQQLD